MTLAACLWLLLAALCVVPTSRAAAVPVTPGPGNRPRMGNISIESNSIQRLVGSESEPLAATALPAAPAGANNGNNQQPPVVTASAGSVQKELKRVFLSNRTVTCNDGSQAGFYLRKSPGSRRWVVFFEGGWHCYDHKSCRARWLKLRHLMTSAQWPETRDGKS